MSQDHSPVRRALLSVSDKAGILPFAQTLQRLGVELLSTGGTYKLLREHDIPVTEIAAHTGFPEIMAGRVKTLHPKVHGGILGRRGEDDAVMAEHGIDPIDLVVVNLYPFQQTVARPDCDLASAIENIDIGGPTMLRAAAKNHRHVGVVVDSADYPALLEELEAGQGLSAVTRFRLAVKCFEHTARYDGAIANYLSSVRENGEREDFGGSLNLQFVKRQALRYGENPHQRAAFYVDQIENVEEGAREASLATATQIQGKELSYNNIADSDAALDCVKRFDSPACVIVKHANPCGVALGSNLSEAYDKAWQTDPTSAFGGILAFNRELDESTARAITERQFAEVIIAPTVSEGARQVLAEKPALRVLACGEWQAPHPSFDYKRVTGGLLVQDRDIAGIEAGDLKVVTQRQPDEEEIRDLLFAWTVVKYVKSNAIVYGRAGQTLGIGAGQMSRVYSARIAAIKAADEGLRVEGAVMASDAFLPFADGVEAANAAGIRAIIQPGGSMRDAEVIAAADAAEIAMVFTGMRHFRH